MQPLILASTLQGKPCYPPLYRLEKIKLGLGALYICPENVRRKVKIVPHILIALFMGAENINYYYFLDFLYFQNLYNKCILILFKITI